MSIGDRLQLINTEIPPGHTHAVLEVEGDGHKLRFTLFFSKDEGQEDEYSPLDPGRLIQHLDRRRQVRR
jgi:hypothetical protein